MEDLLGYSCLSPACLPIYLHTDISMKDDVACLSAGRYSLELSDIVKVRFDYL